MKILFLSLFHPDIVPGGAQRVSYDLFREALAQGHDATLLASVDASKPQFFKPGAVITGFNRRDREYLFLVQDYDYWYHRIRSEIVVSELFDFIAGLAPEVVHVHHFLTFGIDIFALIKRAAPGCRVVFTCHEFLLLCAADGHLVKSTTKRLCSGPSDSGCVNCFPERSLEDFFLRDIWFKQNLDYCDAYVVPSRFMIEFFVENGFAREKFSVIENSRGHMVPRARTPHTTPNKRVSFGFFGQMVDNKGFMLLVDAIEILRKEGLDFFVEFNGGNIRYASEKMRDNFLATLEKERQRPQDDRRFEWNGEYASTDTSRLMDQIDVVIVPSIWWEIYGLVITEAWLHGKPTIGSDVGGPGERIIDGVNGERFSFGSARSLASVMRNFITGEAKVSDYNTFAHLPPDTSEFFEAHMSVYNQAS